MLKDPVFRTAIEKGTVQELDRSYPGMILEEFWKEYNAQVEEFRPPLPEAHEYIPDWSQPSNWYYDRNRRASDLDWGYGGF